MFHPAPPGWNLPRKREDAPWASAPEFALKELSSTPGAPALEFALTKLRTSPGAPAQSSETRLCGVGCLGWACRAEIAL